MPDWGWLIVVCLVIFVVSFSAAYAMAREAWRNDG